MPPEVAGQIVAFLLEECHARMPAATNQQLAQAIDRFSDAELLAYPEFDRDAVRALRRWAAQWRDVEVRL